MAEDDNKKLIEEITRGFAGVREQQHERDAKLGLLSDKMIGVEFKIDQLKETVSKIEADMSKSETDRIKMRVDNLEETAKLVKTKQAENAKWIKGLLASVIMLLLGFLLNFIRIGLK